MAKQIHIRRQKALYIFLFLIKNVVYVYPTLNYLCSCCKIEWQPHLNQSIGRKQYSKNIYALANLK